MSEILMLCILGIGIGGFYAILATGIVVGHKGSGYVPRIHVRNYAGDR